MGATRTNDKSISSIQMCLEFLQTNYPHSYSPSAMEKHLKIPANTISKSCNRLVHRDLIQRPTGFDNTWFQGKPTIYNVANLEDPLIKMHDITLYCQIKPDLKKDKTGCTPPPLYTQEDISTIVSNSKDRTLYQSDYFHINGNIHKCTFQFSEHSITIDLNCNKYQLDQVEYIAYKTWIIGMLQGKGVNVVAIDYDLVKCELGKDYKRITITPTSLLLRDLEIKSWLRIYRKTWNLTRLEIGTTWDGEKAIYELFEKFGKVEGSLIDKKREDPMIG